MKHAVSPYFSPHIRQTCSEFRCLEEREAPAIQEEEEAAEGVEGVSAGEVEWGG